MSVQDISSKLDTDNLFRPSLIISIDLLKIDIYLGIVEKYTELYIKYDVLKDTIRIESDGGLINKKEMVV
jgi:hypothetical protein